MQQFGGADAIAGQREARRDRLGVAPPQPDEVVRRGRRATGIREGTFLVTRPGWRGEVPAGMTRIAAPTDAVWIIGRIMVEGPEDLPAVHALQDRFAMAPLEAWRRGETDAPEVFDAGLAGDVRRPPTARVEAAIERALETVDALRDRPSTDAGERLQGGWSPPMVLDESFGHDWLLRAQVARRCVGALASAEAIYPMARLDAEGRPLSASHRYTIRFPAGGEPPVDCFWSLTMYDARDCVLVPNPIERYRIGDRSRGPQRDAGGGLRIRLQHASPGAAEEANWLPAPEGEFYLRLRACQPRAESLDGRWRPPDIVRAG